MDGKRGIVAIYRRCAEFFLDGVDDGFETAQRRITHPARSVVGGTDVPALTASTMAPATA